MKRSIQESKSRQSNALDAAPREPRPRGRAIRRCEPDQHLDSLAAQVSDAALDVHKTLGPGLLEAVYEEALSVELKLRGVPHRRQLPVAVQYQGFSVGEGRLDLLVDELLVVELKAVEQLAPIPLAQVLAYLKATRLPLGLLITGGRPPAS
jgi:GxxExxY protein